MTVRLLHAILHRALGQAPRWGLLAANVTEAVDPHRKERVKTPYPISGGSPEIP